ncbi:MAG: cadherin domain-containing protein, partial [Microcystaceae cyanobacterium]
MPQKFHSGSIPYVAGKALHIRDNRPMRSHLKKCQKKFSRFRCKVNTLPSSPTLIGSYDTSGWASDVEVVGNTAYVADDGGGLQIIDITTPSAPTLMGSYDTNGYALDVEVVGNTAYVADSYDGLKIIDITTPSAPTLIGSYDTSGWVNEVEVVGNTAYVADGSLGLQIIDITTPSAPTLIGGYDTSGWANDVEVVGNTAYVADGFDLQIIDITTSSAPTFVGSYDTSGRAEDVEVVGNTAYVADGRGGLQIIDVKDFTPSNVAPTDINLSQNTITENASIGTVIGSLITVDPYSNDAFTYSFVSGDGDTDNNLFTIDGNALKANAIFDYETQDTYSIRVQTTDLDGNTYDKALTINVTDNVAPTDIALSNNVIDENQAIGTIIGNLSTIDPNIGEGDSFTYSLVSGDGDTDNDLFTIDGNVLKANAVLDYATQDTYSIRVQTTDLDGNTYTEAFTINVIGIPTLIGSYDTSGYAYDVEVVGNTAYVADDDDGLQIIDITTSSAPTLIGSYDTSGYAYDVEVVGNTAYVADDDDGLKIIDITTPSAPTFVGRYDTSGSAKDVEVVGNTAYVADSSSGLQIIDITTSSAPTFVGSYDTDTSGYAKDVEVVGNTAYVADGYGGLQIIDITTPSAPTLIGRYNTSGYAYDVEVVGNTAYVADSSGGLQIIDITTSSAPTLIGSYDTSGYAYDVEVVGNTAYVADSSGGLKIIDITTPSAPTLIGSYDTSRYAYDVEVVGNTAYIVDSGGGLKILDVNDFTPSNVAPTDINLSHNTLDENTPIDTVIGSLTTVDPYSNDAFTYSFVSGDGDTDNNLFTIDGNALKANAVFDYETQDTYSIRVQTTDLDGNTYDKAFTINVSDVAELSITVDNNSITYQPEDLLSYGHNQDLTGTDQFYDGNTLELTGNNWKALNLTHTITTDSTLTFEFKSEQQGEIQGIGLDNNTKLDQQFFQLYGTQDFGNQDFTYTDVGNWQRFTINLSDYYQMGSVQNHLTFANDDDSNSASDSQFRNIKLSYTEPSNSFEVTVNDSTQTYEAQDVQSYGGTRQDSSGSWLFSDSTTINLAGNNWKALDLSYTITADSLLTFEFKSEQQGEIQGIGLDNNTKLDRRFFKLYGTQDFGNQDFTYTDVGNWQRFTISLSDYYQIDSVQNYLTFANDDDSNSASDSQFRQIEINDVNRITGTNGSDELLGTSEMDLFVINPSHSGIDTINNFEVETDKIGLLDTLSYGSLDITTSGTSDTLISSDSQALAILTGVNPTDLMAADFVNVT